CEQNPMFIPLGSDANTDLNPQIYGQIFENALRVLSDYGFDIAYANRYDGRIETKPRVSPGFLLFLKPGSPDSYTRFLSDLQSYRHRVSIIIHPGPPPGGFFIEVIARKELEDCPRPLRSTVNGAIFQTTPTSERQFEVIDANIPFDGLWIFKGRDVP